MNLSPTDLKKGTVFLLNDQPCISLDYKQKVLGRQSSTVTVKVKFFKNNKQQSYTFSGGENLKPANCRKKTVQFLYQDDSLLHFMDIKDYTQYSLSKDVLEDKLLYLTEGLEVILLLFDDQALTVELPKNVNQEVTVAAEVVKGDTSGMVLKDVETTTGLIVKVPSFIKQGDVISIDTSNGNYRERKK